MKAWLGTLVQCTWLRFHSVKYKMLCGVSSTTPRSFKHPMSNSTDFFSFSILSFLAGDKSSFSRLKSATICEQLQRSNLAIAGTINKIELFSFFEMVWQKRTLNNQLYFGLAIHKRPGIFRKQEVFLLHSTKHNLNCWVKCCIQDLNGMKNREETWIMSKILFFSLVSNLDSWLRVFHLTGGVGISNMIGKIERNEYMGFENLCKYDA